VLPGNRAQVEGKINGKFLAGLQHMRESQSFYQPQTPAIAMIKAKRMMAEAVNHFLIFIFLSF